MQRKHGWTRIIVALLVLATAACQPIRPRPLQPADLTPAASEAAPADAEATPAEQPAAMGSYTGSLSIAGLELEVTVNLAAATGGFTGSIDIPQQGASGIPLHDIRVEPPAIHFEMLEGPQLAVFDGEIGDGGVINGKMVQAGYEGTFTLTPAATDEAATSEQMAGVASTYADPQARFSVPVPTNWAVAEQDGYALLADPEETIKVYLLAVEGDDIATAIADAWQRIDPGFALEIQETLDVPSESGVEKTVVVGYDSDDNNRLVQAQGQLKDGFVYLTLYDVQLAGLQRRQAQLSIVSSGFKILALEETDLAQVQPLTVTEAIVEPLEEFISANMANFDIPGAAVGIVQNGELVYARGFGVADPATGAPVTPETQMMIGSTGKSLTTMMMGTLVDDGLMNWDTRVVDLFPSFKVKDPEISQQITMRNLVCACTGVPRQDFEWLFNYHSLTASDTVASLANFEFYTDFGEAFQYSNQMVATAGYIAGSVASGNGGDLQADYAAALQERVLDPIGMGDTTLSFDAVEERGNYAVPHTAMLDSTHEPIALDMERSLETIGPAGGHWSTLQDMARYMITELNEGVSPDGTRVVSAENLRATWEPQIAVNANTSYGLGWMVTDYKGQPVITHGGNTLGFTSEFTFLPEAELGVIVLTNARASNFFNAGVSSRLLELVFEQEPETQKNLDFLVDRFEEQTAKLEQQIGDAVDASAVTPYLGVFTNEKLGEIVLELTDGVLTLDAGEFRGELLPYSDEDGEFQGYMQVDPPLQGALFKFEQDEEGKPVIVFGEAALKYTFEKQE